MPGRILAVLTIAALLGACRSATPPAAERRADSAARAIAATVSPPAYTPEEHAIYAEAMNTPMAVSQAESYRRIAKVHGLTPHAVDSIVDKVQRAIFTSRPDDSEARRAAARAAVEPYGVVRDVVGIGDFVAVSYVVPGEDWTRQRVQRDLVPQMGRALERIFQVPGIERARLIVWRTWNGGLVRIASVDVQRARFSATQPVSSYPEFELGKDLH